MTTCLAMQLVHEVTEEQFNSHDIQLTLRCGGYVWIARRLPWRHDSVLLTCLWCVAASHRVPLRWSSQDGQTVAY